MLLNEDPGSLQTFFHSPNDSIGMFRMGFTPSKSKMLPQDWIGSKTNLVLTGEDLNEDEFNYFGLCTFPGGRISDEMSSRVREARSAFAKGQLCALSLALI